MPPGQVLWHIDIHLSMFFYEMVVWEADDLVVFFWVSLVGYVGFVECSWSSRKQFSEDRTELIFHERGLTLPLSHLLLHIAQKRLVYQYISKSVSCIISYHTISYHIISYHISYHVMSHHITSYHVSQKPPVHGNQIASISLTWNSALHPWSLTARP